MKKHSFLLSVLFCLFGTLALNAQHRKSTDSLDISDNILTQNLPDMMIAGERPIAKLERGKLTYNVPLLLKQLPADKAFETLRNIPGLDIDNVRFAGKSITLVINGKASTLSQAEVMERLKMMPAEQVANVQIMLAAPAHFHVRGAIINMETKSFSRKAQTSGQVTGIWNQSKYGTSTSRFNLIHSNDKLMLDASYQYANGNAYAEAKHRALHPSNGERIPYYDQTRNKTHNLSHNYRFGLDYQFAERHLLSLAYSGSWKEYDTHNRSIGDSQSTQNSEGLNYLHNVDVDVDYVLPFGLRLSASYLKYEHSKNQDLDGSIFETKKHLIAKSNQSIDKWLLTADQAHDLNNGWQINYGAKAQFTANNSFQTTTTKEGVELPEASSHIAIGERIVKPMRVSANIGASASALRHP